LIRQRRHLSNTQFALILLIPAFFIFGLTAVFPLFQSIFYSFTNKSMLRPISQWVGFSNYINLIRDPVFWEVLYNTFLICFITVTFQLVLGLSLALLLNLPLNLKGRNLFRGLFLSIWVIPFIVVTLLWIWLFNSDYGVINFVLRGMGLIEDFLSWRMDPKLAKVTIIIPLIWRRAPFVMVMLLAGLQSIPQELIEAAKIDGAEALNRFRYITIPHLKGIIFVVFLLSLVDMFKVFIVPYLMTGGGPLYKTTTFSVRVYKLAFQHFDVATAAATGVIWLAFLAFLAAILFPRTS